MLQGDLLAADRLLRRVAEDALPLGYFEPLNSREEQQAVAERPKYNPQFRYAEPDFEPLRVMVSQLERIELPDTGVGMFFRQARDYLKLRLELRMRLGDTPAWQTPIYPLPNERLIAMSRRLLTAPRPPNRHIDRPFKCGDLMQMIRARLRQYRLDEWQVV